MKYNGFNNGRDTTEGTGGKKPYYDTSTPTTMKKPKEQFEEVIKEVKYHSYDTSAVKCESIADQQAIEFLRWYIMDDVEFTEEQSLEYILSRFKKEHYGE